MFHESQVEMQIVNRGEAQGEEFLYAKEVAQVRAGARRTGLAVAIGIQR